MTILIDGYNLIHAAGYLDPQGGDRALEASRRHLIRLLSLTLTIEERKKTTIVFDAQNAPPGLPKQLHESGISVRFADKHEEADDLIEELIRKESVPKTLLLVSSDHRLQTAAQRRKARFVDSEVWISELEDRAEQRRTAADSKKQSDNPDEPASTDKIAPKSTASSKADWYAVFSDVEQEIEAFRDQESEANESSLPEDATADQDQTTSKKDKASPGKKRIEDEMLQLGRELEEELDLENPFPPGYADDLFRDSDE